MPLPVERVITGRFINPVTGEPYNGVNGDHYVTFDPVPDPWLDENGKQVLIGGGRVNLSLDGSFTKSLVCTDAPGLRLAGQLLWRMREHVNGDVADRYFSLPYGDGTPVDIASLVSIEAGSVQHTPIPFTGVTEEDSSQIVPSTAFKIRAADTRMRKSGASATVWIAATPTTAITFQSVGDLLEPRICDSVPPSWRPPVITGFAAASVSGVGAAYIDPRTGRVILSSWTPGRTIATTEIVRLTYTFV